MLSGDFIVPEPCACDHCLRAVWGLEGKVLEQHVGECLRRVGPRDKRTWGVNDVVQYVQRYKERKDSVEEVIEGRKEMALF